MDEPDSLTWLHAWYAIQCDGAWEHEYGVSIETIDNPGWFLKLDLRETGVDGSTFAKREVHRSKNDWFIAHVVDERFESPAVRSILVRSSTNFGCGRQAGSEVFHDR